MDNKTQERIKADAERFTKDEGYQKVYIVAATAEHDRAQVLVDALGKLAVSRQEIFDVRKSTNKNNVKLNAWNDLAFKLRDAKNVLQQWKSGKEKEVEDGMP